MVLTENEIMRNKRRVKANFIVFYYYVSTLVYSLYIVKKCFSIVQLTYTCTYHFNFLLCFLICKIKLKL